MRAQNVAIAGVRNDPKSVLDLDLLGLVRRVLELLVRSHVNEMHSMREKRL